MESAQYVSRGVLRKLSSLRAATCALRLAGSQIPFQTTASVPISPELCYSTRPPPAQSTAGSRDGTSGADGHFSTAGVLSSPVTIYVDVPFASVSQAHSRRPSGQPPVSPAVTLESLVKPKPGEPGRLPSRAPTGSVQDNWESRVPPSRSSSRGRIPINKLFGPFSRRGSFLLQETELRLAAPEWDQEAAEAAKAEASAAAAALALEVEEEAFHAAAMVTAAAEAAREMEHPPRRWLPWRRKQHGHEANGGHRVTVTLNTTPSPKKHHDPPNTSSRTAPAPSHTQSEKTTQETGSKQMGTADLSGQPGLSPPSTQETSGKSRQKKKDKRKGGKPGAAEEPAPTPLGTASPQPLESDRRGSPPAFSADPLHSSAPEDDLFIPSCAAPPPVTGNERGDSLDNVLSSVSHPLPRPVFSLAGEDPSLPSRPQRPRVLAYSAGGEPVSAPPVVVPRSRRPQPGSWESPQAPGQTSAQYGDLCSASPGARGRRRRSWGCDSVWSGAGNDDCLPPFPLPDWSSPPPGGEAPRPSHFTGSPVVFREESQPAALDRKEVRRYPTGLAVHRST